MQTVIYILAALMAVLGISELIHIVALWLFKPRKVPKRVLNVLLDVSCAEAQVMSVLCEFRWSGTKYADKAVFFTDNLPEHIAKRLKKEYSGSYAEFVNGAFYGREKRGGVQRNG